jgi:hypothetical protein
MATTPGGSISKISVPRNNYQHPINCMNTKPHQGGRPFKSAFTLIELPSVIVIVAVLAASFLFTGCGKKPKTSPPATQLATQPAQSSPVPGSSKTAASAPGYVVYSGTNVVNTSHTPPSLKEITAALDRWITRHQRLPTNFAEFTDDPRTVIRVPSPPPGKKYAIDNRRHVILVNR